MARVPKRQEILPLDELQAALIVTIQEANKKWRGVAVTSKGEQKKLASTLREIASGTDPSRCHYTYRRDRPVLVLTKWLIVEVISIKYLVRAGRRDDKPYWRCGLKCIALNDGLESDQGDELITHAFKGTVVDFQQPSLEELLCHPIEIVRTIGKEMSETLPL